MTGRAAGFCAGNAARGYANFGGGRGRGFGRGYGRGWIGPAAPAAIPTGVQELAVLKQQAQQLQADMELIQSRIRELEPKPEQS
jgi:hypothetical protein